ncbi:MAG: hypothetical protein ACU833_05710 [Gammaproteobacteria bacterium]
MTINAVNSAINTINASLHKVEKAAEELAGLPAAEDENLVEDVVRPIIDLNQAELETSAAARIIRAEKEMLGSILDVRA